MNYSAIMQQLNLSNYSLSEPSMNATFSSNPLIAYVHALSILLAVIFIFGIILNTISITAILKFKKLEPINILILNLGKFYKILLF